MEINQLVGCEIQIHAADLFSMPIAAKVEAIESSSNKLLLRFLQPLQIKSSSYLHAIASPRLQRDSLKTLIEGSRLGCAVTLIPQGRYDHSNPFDLGWWRGGNATVADLIYIKK